ncbi:formate dehydrogenase accessory protein FdhE [Robertmurraya kyonggiensis]|uniref:Formate dehydrogenase accessory protein FdhE n=1 Tax=Robertmurraya kyonggiensis TaxID=1037680 RepID=A0A4U1D3E8_9BACI|nr:formate dehydrogenase accessory protein FdhE [Robertmurraya kyonggiensis]TKC16862.1 formate dehydrogenase accessory protein FdhE [Robertmurraya kyonggiensis]
MNVTNKEYQLLEEKIQTLSEQWTNLLEQETVTILEQRSTLKAFPAFSQLQLQIDIEQYRSFILELFSLLKEYQSDLDEALERLEMEITDEVLVQWIKEAIAVNDVYFESFAEKHRVAEWIPFFVAEHPLRPFLQKAAAEMTEELHKAEAQGCCPACGEAPRVAIINKKGKKEITCPRCHYAWEVKKISCAHCGSEEAGKIEILRVEKDDSSEIHVCHDCQGYTKVIDVRKFIQVEAISMLDLKTIHLDIIAQENGFGLVEVKEVH